MRALSLKWYLHPKKCSILRTVLDLRTITYLQSILYTSTIRNIWEWAAWILWIGHLSETHPPWSDPYLTLSISISWLMTLSRINRTSSQKVPSFRMDLYTAFKISEGSEKNHPHWIPFEYFLREGTERQGCRFVPYTFSETKPTDGT